jgi:hypothetical protein
MLVFFPGGPRAPLRCRHSLSEEQALSNADNFVQSGREGARFYVTVARKAIARTAERRNEPDRQIERVELIAYGAASQ